MEHGASGCASFYITPLMVNERRLNPIGQLHSLHTQHCTARHLERMLHHLGLYCSARGCFAITFYQLHPQQPKGGRQMALLPYRVDYSPLVDRPPITWPNNARVAFWVAPNVAHDEYLPDYDGVRNP
jgi:hypothetical protein